MPKEYLGREQHMYGTSIGLPATGAAGGGLLFGALHLSSIALAIIAFIMLAGMLYVLARTLTRRAVDKRP